MRVVEPRKFKHDRPFKKRRKWAVIALSTMAVLSVGWFVTKTVLTTRQHASSEQAAEFSDYVLPGSDDSSVDASQPETETSEAPLAQSSEPKLREFADNDFKIFYDQLLQPNLLPLENPPDISGNTVADARIRAIAEKRGYKLRSSPSVELASIEGYPLQPSVVASWNQLKNAAAVAGLNISVVSGYRSVSNQRSLFLSRLAATGATISQVADGLADDKIDYVLVTSSIPGYSKHHTGYTIDILCSGWAFEDFKNSACNDWITANNYKVAKEAGFIPSYPPSADVQGPDPEAWEYVWVGTDVLHL